MANQNKKDGWLNDLLEETEEEPELAGEKLEIVKHILINVRTNIDRAVKLLEEGYHGDRTLVLDKLEEIKNGIFDERAALSDEQIVEGVFNGQLMVGADGKEYQVPPNYASKSKLVEGDILKLTINNQGNFVFKQIGPIERKRLKAKLRLDQNTKQYYGNFGNKNWKLLTAAVTYFRGDSGDEVIILVPENSKSQWAAVENIVKK